MRATAFAAAFLLLVSSCAAVECACDPQQPETLEQRPCSLCREAERQPPTVEIFILKDISRIKPNRWLALPRAHGSGAHHLHDLPHAARTALWRAAIAKGRSLWGEDWGVAYNGEKVRTQCHTHIHIGKFLRAAERDNYIVVKDASEIPAPEGVGVWVHPVGRRLHVHAGEQICETVLLR